MLRWAPKLSEAGFLVLAGCYKLDLRVQGGIACPDGPRSEDGLAALLAVAHQLPNAKPDSVGVLGLSEGALWTYELLGTRRDIRAAVVDSAAPLDREINGAADSVQAAVLLLASPQDTRTSMLAVQAYERALQDAAKPVESHYYPDGQHVVTLTQPTAEDATQRTIDFFRRQLH
jgi:dienelactone hydrolase